jgi:DNA-binding HxlR family transcriptional regulator
MALLELIGRRWTLRVLWELRAGPLTFRALKAACDDLSPSVLNLRIGELRELTLIELRPDAGYALTPLGSELIEALTPLQQWSERWGTVLS